MQGKHPPSVLYSSPPNSISAEFHNMMRTMGRGGNRSREVLSLKPLEEARAELGCGVSLPGPSSCFMAVKSPEKQ